MISQRVTLSNALLKRLDTNALERDVERFVKKTTEDALENVKKYGVGVSGGREPRGGAPHWQGPIRIPGHYSGYLSDTHYMKMKNPKNGQIVSDAEFVEGVIEGYSTNVANLTFPENRYHKRAVDELLTTNLYGNRVQENWSEIREKR